MRRQIFIASAPVTDRSDADHRLMELTAMAQRWFGGSVTLVSNEVVRSDQSDRESNHHVQHVLTARFAAQQPTPPTSRLVRAADWLGLRG